MDIQDLNVSIDLFSSKEQLDKFLSLAGYNKNYREIIYKDYEGSIWTKTTDSLLYFF